ncbi:hypothetical protein BJX76DRAFT_354159 [Aspergillus varians]
MFLKWFYCALCCGPLRKDMLKIGSREPTALERRQGRVQRQRKAMRDGQLLIEDSFYIKERSYDPELLAERWQWLENIVCFGWGRDISGSRGSFLESLVVCRPPTHPTKYITAPERHFGTVIYLKCYKGNSVLRPVVFPFHQWCCEILARVLKLKVGKETDLDKNILYAVFCDIAQRTRLDLNYGPISGPKSSWNCIAGEEFSVTNPFRIPGLGRMLLSKLCSFELDSSVTALELQQKNGTESFAKLCYDILHQILMYLPASSILALRKISRSFFLATLHNSFWRKFISEFMPWLWEWKHLLPKCDQSVVDFKRFFLWLDRELSVLYGLQGPLRVLANRRRIWHACEQVCDLYLQKASLLASTGQQASRPVNYGILLN